MSNKILPTDKLREAYPKLNEAIDNAENALYKSTNALNTSNSAETKADSVQAQFNQVVIDGDSSVESAQARVDIEGKTSSTLKERLDLQQYYINVKAYGAKGDGVTDDTAAFRAALRSTDPQYNAIDTEDTGRVIYVPPGTYIVNDTIYLRKGDILLGAGGTASNLKSTTDKTILKMGAGLIGGVETEDSGGLIPIADGVFFSSTSTANGIEVQASGWKIQNCWFMNNIGIIARGTDGLIKDCVSDGGLTFLSLKGDGNVMNQTHSIIVSDCLIFAPAYAGISINGIGSVHISNVVFNYCKQYSLYTEGDLTNYEVNIHDCKFNTSFSSDYYALDQKHVYLTSPIKRFSIANSEFVRGVSSDIHIAHADIDMVKIHGCRFFDSFANSLTLIAGNDLYVSDCIWENTGGYPVEASTKVTYKNCEFTNPHINGLPADDYDKSCIRVQQLAGSKSRVINCGTSSETVAVASFRSSATNHYSNGNRSEWMYDTYYYVTGENVSLNERSTNPVDPTNLKKTV